MLVIRHEQLRAFQDVHWERFLGELLLQARLELPLVCAHKSDPELRSLVDAPLRAAASQGILLSADVRRYGLWILRRGRAPEVTGESPVDHALKDPVLMGAAKLDALERAGATHAAH